MQVASQGHGPAAGDLAHVPGRAGRGGQPSRPDGTSGWQEAGSWRRDHRECWEQFAALDRWEFMDKQTKREVWLLVVGTAIVEAPFLAIAVAILSH
jgi:hypothetical protein